MEVMVATCIRNKHKHQHFEYQGFSRTYIDELVQERCNSSALAMELRLSCINPSIFAYNAHSFQ